MTAEQTETNELPDALGFFGDGIISALSIITASLSIRAGVAADVQRDLEIALLEMLKPGRPSGRGNAIAQLALQESIELLSRHPRQASEK